MTNEMFNLQGYGSNNFKTIERPSGGNYLHFAWEI